MLKNLITLVQKLINPKKNTPNTIDGNSRKKKFVSASPHYIFNAEERKAALLQKLVAFVAGDLPKNWKPSRFIYKIGQLHIQKASPLLMQLIADNRAELLDKQFKYSFIYSLGRCKVTAALPWLKSILTNDKEKDFIKRIALDTYLQLQPVASIKLLQDRWKGSAFNETVLVEGKLQLLVQELFLDGIAITWEKNNALTYDLFLGYLISTYNVEFRARLIEKLGSLPLKYPSFQAIRYIFKAAERRDDFEVLGMLAYRIDSANYTFKSDGLFEVTGLIHLFDMSNYTFIGEKKKMAIPKETAFSDRTKAYFQKRTIRYLQTLGEEQVEGYCQLASELLQYYREEESTAVVDKVHYYRVIDNRYRSVTDKFMVFSRLPMVWLTLDTKNQVEVQQAVLNSSYRFDEAYYNKIIDQRSEPFPGLWDEHPSYACTLLQNCNSTYIGKFAVRILWGHEQEQTLITKAVVLQLLKSPVAIVAEYALHHLDRLMPAGEIDWEIILTMIHAKQAVVHKAVIERALNIKTVYFRHPLFLENLAFAQTPLMVDFFRTNAADFKWTKKTKNKIYRRLLSAMSTATNEAQAAIIRENIQIHFTELLTTSSSRQAKRFLQHPLESCQLIGAAIFLAQKEKIEALSSTVILNMLQADFLSVRYKGIEMLACLSVAALIEKKAIIISLAISENPEMRELVKPVITKIADGEAKEAEMFVQFFVPILLQKETYEGLHQDIIELLMNHLDSHLSSISTKMVYQLESSTHRAANILGAFLMEQIDFSKESLTDIIRLANHEMLDIRQYCFTYFNNNIGRVRYESEEALRLLDAKWADSRQFGFDFFEKHFKAGDWTPALLVSVCDSTRTDVQAFGKKMIQRFFQEENGTDYLLQLSQHPSVALQLFATSYLDKYAANNAKQFIQLKPYFKTVLCQLQKGGAAKKKVFDFLEQEARNNKAIAADVIEIINEVILTIGIRDKARCIQILHSIRKTYPDLASVLELKQVA